MAHVCRKETIFSLGNKNATRQVSIIQYGSLKVLNIFASVLIEAMPNFGVPNPSKSSVTNYLSHGKLVNSNLKIHWLIERSIR